MSGFRSGGESRSEPLIVALFSSSRRVHRRMGAVARSAAARRRLIVPRYSSIEAFCPQGLSYGQLLSSRRAPDLQKTRLRSRLRTQQPGFSGPELFKTDGVYLKSTIFLEIVSLPIVRR